MIEDRVVLKKVAHHTLLYSDTPLFCTESVKLYILFPFTPLTRGGGVTCHDFGYGRGVRLESPNPTHSYTRLSEKHDTFIYFPYRKLTPFIYYFFSNFTRSYTFWVKKIPHRYTFDVKMIPVHIDLLGGLKSIPLPAAHLYIPL